MRLRRPLVLALLLALVAVAGPAGAHTLVQRATPGPAETVTDEIDEVVLDFLDPVLPTPEIEVTGPDGRPVAGLGTPELIADDVAAVEFDPLTAAGQYQVDYAYISLDGTPQQDAYRFTFEPDDGIGLDVRSLLAWLVGGVLLVLVALSLLGRRRAGS